MMFFLQYLHKVLTHGIAISMMSVPYLGQAAIKWILVKPQYCSVSFKPRRENRPMMRVGMGLMSPSIHFLTLPDHRVLNRLWSEQLNNNRAKLVLFILM